MFGVNELKPFGLSPLSADSGIEVQELEAIKIKAADPTDKIANTWDTITNKRIMGLDDKLKLKATKFINRVESQLNVKLRVTDGYRTFSEQNALYAQGRTTPGKIVTYAKGGQSLHNFGKAIDVVEMVGGTKPIWRKFSNSIIDIALSLGLKWGGHWNRPDYPHFYIKQ